MNVWGLSCWSAIFEVIIQSINQSINQSNFYRVNIPGIARFSGATAQSVFKAEVDEAVQ